ncbi:uncharacterized protein BT62DRAFT_1010876 [Guyanagaster necrorhizus]|uniref:Uncharacterized protein n=1 Tax=Guyanagaster necrorhizus TaxID=856835 RepID=A0A9P7VKM5_9AGAR|nr:uncharacterized protein BT62DRAFT_1010876 [Guyanagaster necrorhizus MCA 3950]KAG7442095.1 hypothetical protein BT62DRAFT_1010876 [Guyanagaster necrorhizus MCA 3950]
MSVQLPPEIYAHIFEVGVHKWGVGFLPPLCLTCSDWNEIVASTPRLYGIIDFTRSRRRGLVQLSKAKSAPLYLTLPTERRRYNECEKDLLSLVHNWVYASIPTRTLESLKGEDLCSLEELHVTSCGDKDSPKEKLWGAVPSKLRVLGANSVSSSLVKSVLSRGVIQFEFRNIDRWDGCTNSQIFELLTLIPNASSITLESLFLLEGPQPSGESVTSVPMENLLNLHIQSLRCFALHTSHLRAPSLQTFRLIDSYPYDEDHMHWNLVFMQWSQPSFVPANLHTLEIRSSLRETDVPTFIRWLTLLPNVVRLIVDDVALFRCKEANLMEKLASQPVDGEHWFCPSLMQLFVEGDVQVVDLIAIAGARGGVVEPPFATTSRPSRLRLIEAPLCVSGWDDEIAELKRLVDETHCSCLSCALGLLRVILSVDLFQVVCINFHATVIQLSVSVTTYVRLT